MNSPLPQAEIRGILSGKCFVHKATENDMLFVSDAPRRFTDEQLSMLSGRLTDLGFRQWSTGKSLWAIDMDEQRWLQLMKPFESFAIGSIPEDARLLDVYALMRLLFAHPAYWVNQPREPIRALLKRFDQPEEFIHIVPVLLQNSAKWLREHQPLPSAAAGILSVWLMEFAKEAKL